MLGFLKGLPWPQHKLWALTARRFLFSPKGNTYQYPVTLHGDAPELSTDIPSHSCCGFWCPLAPNCLYFHRHKAQGVQWVAKTSNSPHPLFQLPAHPQQEHHKVGDSVLKRSPGAGTPRQPQNTTSALDFRGENQTRASLRNA